MKNWLKSSSVADHTISLALNKQWLQFDATIAELEDLFHTEYYEYKHMDSGNSALGCDE